MKENRASDTEGPTILHDHHKDNKRQHLVLWHKGVYKRNHLSNKTQTHIHVQTDLATNNKINGYTHQLEASSRKILINTGTKDDWEKRRKRNGWGDYCRGGRRGLERVGWERGGDLELGGFIFFLFEGGVGEWGQWGPTRDKPPHGCTWFVGPLGMMMAGPLFLFSHSSTWVYE